MGDVTVVQAILYIQWINCAIWFRWKAENRLKEIKKKNSNKKLQLVFLSTKQMHFFQYPAGGDFSGCKNTIVYDKIDLWTL